MGKKENKKQIVYKTAEETLIVTDKDVDVTWIEKVNDSLRKDSSRARKDRRYCYRLDIANDKDEWVASHENDPFYNLCRETPEEERNRLYHAISQLTEVEQRMIDYEYFKGYSHKRIAEMEGVSRQAVEQRLERIIKKLQEIF